MRKAFHLFGVLDERDLNWLVEHGDAKFFSRGSEIIKEGEPIGALFIVLDGKLSIRVAAGGGREVAVLYAGEILGEISFVSATAPTASAIAVEDSHLLSVDAELLKAKLASDSSFSSRFYRALAGFLADRLRTTTQRLGYDTSEADPDEIADEAFDEISRARTRVDELIRRLRVH
jgi:CRP/FNR family transcriptional regulator, cyclic AMP receptor protein